MTRRGGRLAARAAGCTFALTACGLFPSDPGTGALFLTKQGNDYVIVLPSACRYPGQLGLRVTAFTGATDQDARVYWSTTVDNDPPRLRIAVGAPGLAHATTTPFTRFADADMVSVDAFVAEVGPSWTNVFTVREVQGSINGGDRISGSVTGAALESPDNCPNT